MKFAEGTVRKSSELPLARLVCPSVLVLSGMTLSVSSSPSSSDCLLKPSTLELKRSKARACGRGRETSGYRLRLSPPFSSILLLLPLFTFEVDPAGLLPWFLASAFSATLAPAPIALNLKVSSHDGLVVIPQIA